MMKNAYRYLRARRSLLMAGLLAATCATLWAQPDGPGGPPPGEMQGQQMRGPGVDRELKQLTRLLTLTTDQQTQVKAILADQRTQMEALFKHSMPDNASGESEPPSQGAMETMRASMKTLREASNDRIAAILTGDQPAKFKAWREKRAKAAERNEGMPPDGGGPPPDGGGPGGPPGF